MKISKVSNSIYKGIDAYFAAHTGRKLVRQVDTGTRKLNNMCTNSKTKYRKCISDAGHYSKNPLNRLVSFIKAWKSNFQAWGKNKTQA